MKNKLSTQNILIFLIFAFILMFIYFMDNTQNIVKTISPVMSIKDGHKIMDSGDPITFTGVLKNERILFTQGKWAKSFRGHFTLNGIEYHFNTMYVGRSTLETFVGPLTWFEYGKEQKSAINFKKDLSAFQFTKTDTQQINGPSSNLAEWRKWFSFFTTTEMK